MHGKFVPFAGIPVKVGTSTFISTTFNTPAKPGAPATVVTTEQYDLPGKIRQALAALPGMADNDAELKKTTDALQSLFQQSPARLALPSLKVQADPAKIESKSPPAIHMEKEGDRVSRIKVNCTCGETIVLDCTY